MTDSAVTDLPYRLRFDRKLGYGRAGQIPQTFATMAKILDNRATHPRIPELADMLVNALDRRLAVGFGIEETTDVVGHFDQVFYVHRSEIMGVVNQSMRIGINHMIIVAGEANQR